MADRKERLTVGGSGRGEGGKDRIDSFTLEPRKRPDFRERKTHVNGWGREKRVAGGDDKG